MVRPDDWVNLMLVLMLVLFHGDRQTVTGLGGCPSAEAPITLADADSTFPAAAANSLTSL